MCTRADLQVSVTFVYIRDKSCPHCIRYWLVKDHRKQRRLNAFCLTKSLLTSPSTAKPQVRIFGVDVSSVFVAPSRATLLRLGKHHTERGLAAGLC